jgi:hypothetical protein
MTGIAEKKKQNSLISYMGVFLVFFVLLAGCISSSLLFFSTVSYASSTTARSGKPPLSFSSPANGATSPTATTSRFITHNDTSATMNADGCNQATAFVGGVVILDFGETAYQNGAYGTFLPGTSSGFVSNTTVKALVKQYLSGYASCDTNTTGAYLILGIGTDNGGSYMTSTTNASSAGQEWATIVGNIKLWISSHKLAKKERVFGAAQIELENNTATITRAWTDGFGMVSSNSGVNYINYGDATGCPTVDSTSDGQCSNGWMQSDIAYVSWDALAAYALPQIYDTAGNDALQWQSIEYYQRINNLGGSFGPMFIQGSVTQYQACLQVGSCQGTDNTPGEGWQQIYNALQSSSVTAQPKVWDSTDFQWDN